MSKESINQYDAMGTGVIEWDWFKMGNHKCRYRLQVSLIQILMRYNNYISDVII